MRVDTLGGQKKPSDALEVELKRAVSFPVCAETECGSSARAAYPFNQSCDGYFQQYTPLIESALRVTNHTWYA